MGLGHIHGDTHLSAIARRALRIAAVVTQGNAQILAFPGPVERRANLPLGTWSRHACCSASKRHLRPIRLDLALLPRRATTLDAVVADAFRAGRGRAGPNTFLTRRALARDTRFEADALLLLIVERLARRSVGARSFRVAGLATLMLDAEKTFGAGVLDVERRVADAVVTLRLQTVRDAGAHAGFATWPERLTTRCSGAAVGIRAALVGFADVRVAAL